jgi:short-subunit dehydrogenase
MANDKYALITGATSGIGYELAKLFAKDKYNLVIVARTDSDLERCAAEFRQEGIDVIPIATDLSKEEAALALYDDVTMRGIDIDVLVNNAGQGQYGEFINTDLQRELEIIRLNIMATVILTKAFLKDMVQKGSGKILQLSSIAGKLPGPLQSVYHATKAFIDSHTTALATELKDSGITITALLPGPTETDFFNKADMTETKMVKEGSVADPAKVAADGYKALMNGESYIISGLKNKMQVGMADMMPDTASAAMIEKQMQPSDK